MSAATTSNRKIRIGTRGSPLALVQAELVKKALLDAHAELAGGDIDIVPMSTRGDRIKDKSLADLGGKGLFTEEIEAGLSNGTLDIAVHSMKDMPTELPGGLVIDCILPREDVRDVFISPKAASLQDLPPGSVVGTASLRRQAQTRKIRPDLDVIVFRGNVSTRLKKLEEGVADATFLALSGLKRLGMESVATRIMNPMEMLPAIAQGAIGVEARADDRQIAALLAPLNDSSSQICVTAERAFLAALDGSCRTPIAGLATLDNDVLSFSGEILRPDGSEHFTATREGAPMDAVALGRDAGEELRALAGPGFFTE